MFTSVLIANRGEIACRIIGTLRRLGVESVAVYVDDDFGAKHVALADVALKVTGYLDIGSIIDVAVRSGAQAIHPGYGFLSENAEFARACAAAGIVFIGPSEHALDTMGDKIRAKAHVAARGVPVIPGTGASEMTDSSLIAAAENIGFPLLIKPSAGGGGKGMTAVSVISELPAALTAARRVAAKAFGDDTLMLERLITTPRHIEVQVLADSHGMTIHLGERECSLQRRNQKVIEEAPSPLLDRVGRAEIGAAAVEVARSVDYVGAGTVEFLVSDDNPDEFFFIEMNTRLQVEHPVTELVTGVDLVQWQVRIAAGEPLDLEPVTRGHAIEARLYAEDSETFLPATGRVDVLHEAVGDGVRVDSSLVEGVEVTSRFDPMLAKIVAWGSDRAEALARLERALTETTVLGVRTNLAFLLALVRDDAVRAGRLDTGLIERLAFENPAPDATTTATAALIEHAFRAPPGNPWRQATGWRLGEHRAPEYFGVAVSGLPPTSTVAGAPARFALGEHTATIDLDGETRTYHWLRTDDATWLSRAGVAFVLPRPSRENRLAQHRASLGRAEGAADPEVRSAMPGTVIAVVAATGTVVEQGQPLLTIEAMKLEHTMLASVAGVVTLTVAPGDQVRLDQVVARIDPHEGAAA